MFFFCILYNFCLNISRSKKNSVRYDKKMCIGLHLKYPLFLSYLCVTCIFSTNFLKKNYNIKLHGNLSTGNRVVPRGQRD